MDWLSLLAAFGGLAGLSGLLATIGNILNQRRQTKADLKKQLYEHEFRQQELDSLEHNMVVEIAQKYRDFNQEFEAKIALLQEELAEYRELLEEKEADNNQLRQTNLLYEERIKFLEESLVTQHKETNRLKRLLLEQNREFKELKAQVENGTKSDSK
jgi:chromosome segregation ATPase